MNLGTKGKKRVVLPSRPEPPAVEHILEDVQNSASEDPLFTLLCQADPGLGQSSSDSEVELRFEQCRRFMELNQRLTEAQERLKGQRNELMMKSDSLEQYIQDVRTRMLNSASSQKAWAVSIPRTGFTQTLNDVSDISRDRVQPKNCLFMIWSEI